MLSERRKAYNRGKFSKGFRPMSESARFNMVEQQVRPWEVLDTRVLEVLGELKREDFVPVQHRQIAYVDLSIPLEHGEFMMKPVVEGRMLQALDLSGEEDVLEIGSGSGYTAACLSRLARQVVSIEIHGDLAERARAQVGAAGIRNCQVLAKDAFDFHPAQSFDAIAVTGAVAQERFAAAGRQPAQPEVHLRADQNAPYRYVAQTLADASRAGLTRIGFVSEPEAAR